jgi:PAS domain S-box-containing protein
METRKPIIAGIAVFVAIGILTQLLTYQQYLIHERSELSKVSQEANRISDKLKTSLSFSLSATKTLAFVVKQYGVPKQFDSIAAQILESNNFIDAVELTRKGVITHVYPLQGNEEAVGYDVLADSLRTREALKAISRKALFFAGPFELKQGGTAVVGRLPIFIDNSFWGFSVVLIKLSTLLNASGINDASNSVYRYQLSKRNPSTGTEEFFLPHGVPSNGHAASVELADGEWKLYVVSKEPSAFFSQVIPFFVLGFLLSVTGGLFTWHFTRQPEKLKNTVDRITAEMDDYQRTATRSLQRVNRLYHFTSRINQMVVHVNNEDEMYSQVCNIAVDIGKFRMAWVGIIREPEQKIVAIFSAGDDNGYLDEITPISLTSDAVEGPAMRMIRTGTYVHFNDIASDPLMKPWAEKALSRGYRSSILLPIRKSGQIIGSFNLYSPEPFSFDQNEIDLLLETTANISFTLENFERDRKRRQAEQQIESEKILSDSIINSLPGIFYLYDVHGKFLKWNKNFETISGYAGEEVSNMHPLDFFRGEEQQLVKNRIAEVFSSGYAEVVARFTTKDRQTIPYFFNGRKIIFDGKDYLIGMGLDISERLNAENALLQRTEEIEKLSAHLQNIREEERSRIALEIHDVLGQQLTALKMDSTWLKKRFTQDEVACERISGMISLIDDTIRTVRRISSELRPGILDDLGLVAALEWQGSEFEKNTGIEIGFETNKSDVELERNFSTNIFRIYQETLTNIARHANATSVKTIFAHYADHIRLEVRDNGIGVDFDSVRDKKSLGLISMKERARLFNGEVVIENISPHGTMVTLKIPLLSNGTKG